MTLLALAALLSSSPALALDPPRGGATFGLGVGGGTGISGLSGKYWLGEHNAFQGIVGTYGSGRYKDYAGNTYYTGLGIGLDYLYEMPSLVETEPVIIGWNLGFGASVGLADNTFVGAAGVLGLEADFQPVPIDLVLEYRPGLLLYPGVGADLWNFTGQLRFYFL